MAKMRCKYMQAASPAAGTPVFRMAGRDSALDRHGDRLLPGALSLPAGDSDIPLYWEHEHQQRRPPIGRAKVWEEAGEWLMSPAFSDATQTAREAKALVEDGTIRACSVGYLTRSAQPNEAGGEDVHQAELVEVSLTGIPAKPEAVRVKTMDSEEMMKKFQTLCADVTEMKATLAKMAAPSPEEEAPPEETKSDEAPEKEKPAPEEDVVAKFFRGLTTSTVTPRTK